MVNVAVVGCAHIHTPGFIKTLNERKHEIKVTAVWDHHGERGRRRAGELDAPFVEDVKRIWKDKTVQAVVICSETNRHEELVLAAARAGKHMFVEKPLGLGARDSYKMAAAVRRAGVMFTTGYFNRSIPAHLFLREQIRAGNFGQITRIRGANCHSGALGGWFDTRPEDPAADWRWMADPAVAGCGGFGDLGTHLLDIMIWLMGDVRQVTAQTTPGTNRYDGCDEEGEGLIRFENGAIGTLAAGWDDLDNPVSLLVSGTAGHAYILHGSLYFKSSKVEGADGKEPWTRLPEGWPHAFSVFCDAIAGRKSGELVDATEAAYRVAVMEAMYEGAARSKWVAPKVPQPDAAARASANT
jgi:predicted dehydrogenase